MDFVAKGRLHTGKSQWAEIHVATSLLLWSRCCKHPPSRPTPHPERSKSSSWNRLTAWARAPGALCQASARLRRGANKLRGNVRCSTAASAAAPWKTHPSQSCTRSDANG
eukprot:scaffold6684_cov19-Tisochrysis_lutea.AAC.1